MLNKASGTCKQYLKIKVSNQSIELVDQSGLIHIDPLFNTRYGKPIRWISDPTLTKKEGFTNGYVVGIILSLLLWFMKGEKMSGL